MGLTPPGGVSKGRGVQPPPDETPEPPLEETRVSMWDVDCKVSNVIRDDSWLKMCDPHEYASRVP